MRFLILIFLALSCISWGQFVFAAYTFRVEGSANYVQSGPFSSLSALKSANSSQWIYGPGSTSNSNYIASMTCNKNASSNNIAGCPYNGFRFYISRFGTCELPNVTNPDTGECEAPPPPPPECKVGDLFPSKGSVGPVITSDNGSKHVSSNPQTMCQNQCEYADPTARPSGCYALPGDQGYCNFIIKGTGNNCSADNYEIAVSGDRLNPPDTPNVPDSSPDPICPPGWTSSGGTCFKNPPKFCDPSTGEICAPGTTDPDKPAPDAGTGGTEGTPGEGEGGRPDSSNGADKDLQDLQDSKPDAEACKPAADGSGCSGSTVKGEQCDKVVECTGDAVQCSILRQQKKMACAYEYEEARPFIEQQIAKEPYQVKSESVSGSELFTAGLNAPRWMPQGCPAPKSISIKGVSTSLSFEPACDFARGLGPLFVALASIFFAVYVGRAFGGN